MDQSRQTKKKHLLLTTNQPTRSDELLITAVLIALLLLIGIVGLFWSTWNRVVLAPTATPTITRIQTITSTPDLPATRNASQLETQTVIALQITRLSGTETAVAELVATVATAQVASASLVPTVDSSSQTTVTIGETLTNTTPVSDTGPLVTPTGVTIYGPAFPSGGQATNDSSEPGALATTSITTTDIAPQFTVTSTVESASSGDSTPEIQPQETTEINVPVILNNSVANTPPPAEPNTVNTLVPNNVTPAPEITATSVITPTATPIVIPPTETPVPTFTPTPTRFVQAQLNGVVNVNDTKLRVSPGGSEKGKLTENFGVTLSSRSASGEWVNVCCLNGQFGWVRQSELTIAGNVFDDGAPAEADPNDVRWLNVDAGASTAPPQVLAVPVGSYPLLRGNTANYGVVGQLPSGVVSSIWQNRQGLASANLISPIAMSNNGIFVSTDDGYLFSFNKDTGDTRWRWRHEGGASQRITKVAAIKDNQLYLVNDSGNVFNIEDKTTFAEERWQVELKTGDQDNAQTLTAVTSLAIQGDCLYLGAKNGDAHYLVSIRQFDGLFCFTAKSIDGISMQHLALGGQLIFIGSDRGIFARDVSSGDSVWGELDNFKDISAPPIYSYPGVDSLAELYVVRNGGDIIALNANTGTQLWVFASGETVTGLTLDDKNLYATGNGFIKVISRTEQGQIARIDINGTVPTGPLLSSTHLLALTDFGDMLFVDTTTLELESRQPADSAGIRHFVANGPVVYLHEGGTAVRALRGQ